MLQDALAAMGPQSGHLVELWRLMLGMCALVYVAVMAGLWIAMRRAPKDRDALAPPSLEPGSRRSATGIAIAVALSTVGLFVLIIASIGTDRALARLPLENALHIELTGHQWWWEARYDADKPSKMFSTANELHLPAGRPVIFTLRSADVIHSFWVPNLSGKKDLVPGRTATLHLRADQPGTYGAPCAEFCGLQHARMVLTVVVEPVERYEAWAGRQRQSAPAPGEPLAMRGRDVLLGSTCAMCHTVSGTEASGKAGPDLTHVGSRLRIGAGVLPNTPDRLAKWIANPSDFKPGANMPAHALVPDDLNALAAYLTSLK
jgi:cytochrome c oxidase subunit II